MAVTYIPGSNPWAGVGRALGEALGKNISKKHEEERKEKKNKEMQAKLAELTSDEKWNTYDTATKQLKLFSVLSPYGDAARILGTQLLEAEKLEATKQEFEFKKKPYDRKTLEHISKISGVPLESLEGIADQKDLINQVAKEGMKAKRTLTPEQQVAQQAYLTNQAPGPVSGKTWAETDVDEAYLDAQILGGDKYATTIKSIKNSMINNEIKKKEAEQDEYVETAKEQLAKSNVDLANKLQDDIEGTTKRKIALEGMDRYKNYTGWNFRNKFAELTKQDWLRDPRTEAFKTYKKEYFSDFSRIAGGKVSNFEFMKMEDMLPDIGKSPEANEAIVDYFLLKENINSAYQKAALEILAENKSIPPIDFRQQLHKRTEKLIESYVDQWREKGSLDKYLKSTGQEPVQEKEIEKKRQEILDRKKGVPPGRQNVPAQQGAQAPQPPQQRQNTPPQPGTRVKVENKQTGVRGTTIWQPGMERFYELVD